MPLGFRAWVLVPAVMLGSHLDAQVSTSPERIARSMVIGQAYVSGNVYVAGFVEQEPRSWPRAIDGVPLAEERPERIAADFFRTVVQDSEEHYYFPQRESDGAEGDVFVTIDKAAIEDRNLARYRAPVPVDRAVTFVGWDRALPIEKVSYAERGQARPLTDEERKEIVAAKAAVPATIECSTVPAFLDAATIILTAAIGNSTTSIRLSKYLNPGCAGHLSEIYVLDVLTPGQAPRRFEFRHYHGVL